MPVLAAAVAAGASCSAGGGKAQDAAFEVLGFDVSLGELPPGCPENVVENNKHVGRRCTAGGGQCDPTTVCACDVIAGYRLPEGTPCLCTLPLVMKGCDDPTVPADYCGNDATCCGYLTTAALCVPNLCLYDMACPVLVPP